MGKVFKVRLSGDANARHTREFEIDLNNVGISDADWDKMDAARKDTVMREIITCRLCRSA
jgi:hypothetical protein